MRDHHCRANSVRPTSSIRADMIFGRDRCWSSLRPFCPLLCVELPFSVPAAEFRLVWNRRLQHVQHAGGRLERGRALLRRVAVVLYALLMPKARRQRLAAYFTPPHLADHAIRAMIDAGIRPGRHRILDPASGGAAFLVPLAARIAESGHKRGARAAGRSHLSPRHLAQSGAAGATVSPLL
jgi:hypothetical protein